MHEWRARQFFPKDEEKTRPRCVNQLTVGILGYGNIGKSIAKLFKVSLILCLVHHISTVTMYFIFTFMVWRRGIEQMEKSDRFRVGGGRGVVLIQYFIFSGNFFFVNVALVALFCLAIYFISYIFLYLVFSDHMFPEFLGQFQHCSKHAAQKRILYLAHT